LIISEVRPIRRHLGESINAFPPSRALDTALAATSPPASPNYLRLSDGLTHLLREGPADGIPIVLVHGATVPHWEFDALIPPLLRAGFQTLRFDLYGHGASDRPPGNYSLERFRTQLIEIIEASSFQRPAMMLGHSFGAALAAALTADRPEWVTRLVLVAPMLDFNSSSAWTRLFRLPGIGELAMRFIGVPALVRRRRRRYGKIGKPYLTPWFIEQVSRPGFSRGLLSMIRTGALGNQGALYSALRNCGHEILVISGEHDAIIPSDHLARVRTLLPDHDHCTIAAEHNLLLTHPDEVVGRIVRWIGPDQDSLRR
jgi:pimeloyl-ACP methyl ester carboxylesterase